MASGVATKNRSLVVASLAAIGASACCIGPFGLLMLGVGGVWIGNLTALEPYRPIFIGAMLVFLGLAFRKLYLVPEACEPGKVCANPVTRRSQRIVFWAVAAILGLLVAFPWYAPALLG